MNFSTSSGGTGNHNGRQILQQFEDRLAITQNAASNLSRHERMHQDGRSLEQSN